MNNNVSTTSRWIAAAASFVAFLTHAYLSTKGYQLKMGLGEKSLCNLGGSFNCDAVSLSPYANLFGLPLANFGAIYNLVLALLIVVGALGLSTQQGRIDRWTWLLAFVSALVSLVMGGISAFALQTYCLFCIFTYVLSFLVLGLLWPIGGARPESWGQTFAALAGPSRWIGGLLLAIPVGAFVWNSMASKDFGLQAMQTRVSEYIMAWERAPEVSFDTSMGLKLKPDGDYKLVLVEFADFLCPHCKIAANPLHSFSQSRPDTQLIFIPFPLDGACNSGVNSRGNGLRCQLTALTLCAEKLGQKGWLAHDLIFDRQEQHTVSNFPETLQSVANLAKIDEAPLKECVESGEIKDLIQKGVDQGLKANIPGTPSIFANGRKLDYGHAIPVLNAVAEKLR